MMSPVLLLIGWILHIALCFYVFRFISNTTIRCIATLVPCVILTYMVAYDLPRLHMPSMLFVTYCWLASIRLIHFNVLTPNHCTTFSSCILKILWMVYPIVPCTSYQHEKWPIHYDLISAGIKLICNNWIYRWLLTCPGSDSYSRSIMFYIFVLTYSFLMEAQCAIVRLVTGDKYMLKPTVNFPFLAQTLRDFWGRRYNQLVGTIFRESIFQPIRQYISSASIASFIVFFISGLLHVHLAFITFRDTRAIVSNMLFFLVHGVACAIEVNTPFRLPVFLSWLLTQLFLLATASLQLGPFTRAGPEFYAINPPLLFEQKWVPRLPVPSFCPK